MRDVALIGPMKVGKDSVAEKLALYYDYKRVAFADPLKWEVAAALSYVSRRNYSITEINADKDRFRTVLQWWGTEFRRREDPEYWVYLLHNTIRGIKNKEPDQRIVCTDARFENELSMLKAEGFVIIELIPDKQLQQPDHSHASEHEWRGSQHITLSLINRFGKLDETVRQVVDVLDDITLGSEVTTIMPTSVATLLQSDG